MSRSSPQAEELRHAFTILFIHLGAGVFGFASSIYYITTRGLPPRITTAATIGIVTQSAALVLVINNISGEGGDRVEDNGI
jgi:hypothetical protein